MLGLQQKEPSGVKCSVFEKDPVDNQHRNVALDPFKCEDKEALDKSLNQ